MNKKFILSLIIFFILVLGVGFFYVTGRKAKVSNNLTVYLPKETVLYLEYNLADEKLAALNENGFSSANTWQSFWTALEITKGWPVDLLKEIKKIGYAIAEIDGRQKSFWLLEVNNVRRAYSFLPANYASNIMDAEMMVLAKDKKDLNLISNDFLELEEARAKILEKFSLDNFLNVYLAPEFYKKHLTGLGFNFFNKLNLTAPIFLGLKLGNGQLVFNLETLTNEKELNNFKNDDQNIAPLDSFEDLFMVLKLSDSRAVLDILIGSEFLNKQTISNNLADTFSGPAVFFGQTKTKKIAPKNIFQLNSYYYGFAIKLSVDQPANEQVNLIKEVIKKNLAFNYPQERIKKLPDGTRMTELVTDENVFEFKPAGALEYVDYSGLNLVLAVKDGYLILSNNRSLLENILALNINDDKTEACLDFSGQEVVYLKTGQLENSLLNLVGSIMFDVKQSGEELKIEGCLE